MVGKFCLLVYRRLCQIDAIDLAKGTRTPRFD
jgi:hypothetical protein